MSHLQPAIERNRLLHRGSVSFSIFLAFGTHAVVPSLQYVGFYRPHDSHRTFAPFAWQSGQALGCSSSIMFQPHNLLRTINSFHTPGT